MLTEKGRDLVASTLDREREEFDNFPPVAPVRVFRDDQVKKHYQLLSADLKYCLLVWLCLKILPGMICRRQD